MTTAAPGWRRFWPSPSPALADAGVHGEIVVARGRLGLTAAIVGVPLSTALTTGWSLESLIGLGFATFAAILALAIYLFVCGGRRLPWLGFATSIGDVTIVSLLQVAYLIVGMPAIAANSRTTYPMYLVAIAATAMRWDVRVCLAAGAVATLQYAGIAVTAWHMWSGQPTPETAMYGQIVPGQQVARLIILITTTWVAARVVRQSSGLRLLDAKRQGRDRVVVREAVSG